MIVFDEFLQRLGQGLELTRRGEDGQQQSNNQQTNDGSQHRHQNWFDHFGQGF